MLVSFYGISDRFRTEYESEESSYNNRFRYENNRIIDNNSNEILGRYGQVIVQPRVNLNKKNLDLSTRLRLEKDDNGKQRFSSEYLGLLISSKVTPSKLSVLDKLISDRDENGNLRFSQKDIYQIYSLVSKNNAEIVTKMIDSKSEKGEGRFSVRDIKDIASTISSFRMNPDDASSFDKALNYRKNDGSFKYDADDLLDILLNMKKLNQ